MDCRYKEHSENYSMDYSRAIKRDRNETKKIADKFRRKTKMSAKL